MCAISWVPRFLTNWLSSFQLSESSYICFMYTVQEFQLYEARETGKNTSIPSFQKWKSSHFIFSVSTLNCTSNFSTYTRL